MYSRDSSSVLLPDPGSLQLERFGRVRDDDPLDLRRIGSLTVDLQQPPERRTRCEYFPIRFLQKSCVDRCSECTSSRVYI